jgi:hypothetical protein
MKPDRGKGGVGRYVFAKAHHGTFGNNDNLNGRQKCGQFVTHLKKQRHSLTTVHVQASIE